jgi:hypothetical protein
MDNQRLQRPEEKSGEAVNHYNTKDCTEHLK